MSCDMKCCSDLMQQLQYLISVYKQAMESCLLELIAVLEPVTGLIEDKVYKGPRGKRIPPCRGALTRPQIAVAEAAHLLEAASWVCSSSLSRNLFFSAVRLSSSLQRCVICSSSRGSRLSRVAVFSLSSWMDAWYHVIPSLLP